MKPNTLLIPVLAPLLGMLAIACGPTSNFQLAPDASTADTNADGGAPEIDAGPDAAAARDASDAHAPPIEGGRCPAGYADCDGDPHNGCEAKLDDLKTCGACDHDCTGLAHVATAAGVTCHQGACAVSPSACAPGFAHCSSRADDGCEVDLGKPDHCGSCATSCTGSTPVCSGGACGNGCGAATPTSCGGSCVDVKTSAANCGSCGNACPSPSHGQAACAAGACSFACNGGYHACGSTCADNTSVASCGASCTPCAAPSGAGHATCGSNGACGMACDAGHHLCGTTCVDNGSVLTCGASCTPCAGPASNGHATCNGNGTCGIACDGGYHACGSACSSNNSVASCGASCSPCATPANAVATCNGVACGFTCNGGYADCDGNAANGCEAKLDSDGNNCASCGHSCLGGACSASACQPVKIVDAPSSTWLAVDDTSLYYVDQNGLEAHRKDNSAGWSVGLSLGSHGVALAQDAAAVYTRDSAGVVLKFAKNNAATTVLGQQVSQLPGAGSLVVGGGNVYFTDTYTKQMYYVSTAGGSIYPVYTVIGNFTLGRMAADSSGLMWIEGGSAGRVIKSDFAVANYGPLPLSSPQYYSSSLALDAAYAYWTNPDGTVWSIKRDGTSLTQLAAQQGSPTNVAVDAQFAYWTSGSEVRKVPTRGGAVRTVVSSGTPFAVVTDDAAIYWTDNNGSSGGVWKLAK